MRKQKYTLFFAGLGMLLLILDTKTAFLGMTAGIEICLYTLIPSLFPFILVATVLTGNLVGCTIPLASRLGRFMSMPSGTESIFVIGLLGGYPVGAQCVSQAVKNGHISRENGSRMLAFCSNAGPAFIFGIGTNLFASTWQCWQLWAIHIISAIVVGSLTPPAPFNATTATSENTLSLTYALRNAVKTMAQICGWVTIFRVILQFSQRWFLWILPKDAQLLFSGFLELANGSYALWQTDDLEIRGKLFALFLGFGGICVAMQTASVCEGLDLRWYMCGKVTQALVSYFLAEIFFSREIVTSLLGLTAVGILYYLLSRKGQNRLAFLHISVYNKENIQRGKCNAISKENRTPMRILQTQYTDK